MTTVTVDTALVERPAAWGNTAQYNVAEVIMPNNANPIAGGAGQAITVSVAFSEQNLPSTFDYTVVTTASQPCAVSYASKAVTGFNVILTPLASEILAAGTFDCVVTWPNGGAA